jgi:hypothetical protein
VVNFFNIAAFPPYAANGKRSTKRCVNRRNLDVLAFIVTVRANRAFTD